MCETVEIKRHEELPNKGFRLLCSKFNAKREKDMYYIKMRDEKGKLARTRMIGEAEWDGGHLTDDSIHSNGV